MMWSRWYVDAVHTQDECKYTCQRQLQADVVFSSVSCQLMGWSAVYTALCQPNTDRRGRGHLKMTVVVGTWMTREWYDRGWDVPGRRLLLTGGDTTRIDNASSTLSVMNASIRQKRTFINHNDTTAATVPHLADQYILSSPRWRTVNKNIEAQPNLLAPIYSTASTRYNDVKILVLLECRQKRAVKAIDWSW